MPQRTTIALAAVTVSFIFLFNGNGLLVGQSVLPKNDNTLHHNTLPFASRFEDACSLTDSAVQTPDSLIVYQESPTLISAWIDLNFPVRNHEAYTTAALTVKPAVPEIEKSRFARLSPQPSRHEQTVPTAKSLLSAESFSAESFSAESSGVSIENSSPVSQYCQKMAKLLASSLRNSTADQIIQEQAIESTMRLVAESVAATTEAQNQVKIAQLKNQHYSQLIQLNAEHMRQLLQLQRQSELRPGADSDSSQAVSQFNQRLEPVYENLSRNNQQLEVLARNNATLQRTMATIERTITPTKVSAPKVIQNRLYEHSQSQPQTELHSRSQTATIEHLSDAYYEAYANMPLDSRSSVAQSNQIREQIRELTQRLQQLEESDTDVRRVNYLEPVYNSSQTLKPLSLSPNPALSSPEESSRLPSNQYRHQMNPRHNAND